MIVSLFSWPNWCLKIPSQRPICERQSSTSFHHDSQCSMMQNFQFVLNKIALGWREPISDEYVIHVNGCFCLHSWSAKEGRKRHKNMLFITTFTHAVLFNFHRVSKRMSSEMKKKSPWRKELLLFLSKAS